MLVDVDGLKEMQDAFERAHKQRFGFIAKDRGLVVEALSVEAIGDAESIVEEAKMSAVDSEPPTPHALVKMFSNGQFRRTPLYLRERLVPGQYIVGPAIIVEQTGTVVVEDGWVAEINNSGHLLLDRAKKNGGNSHRNLSRPGHARSLQ